jgi:hypothetical protein
MKLFSGGVSQYCPSLDGKSKKKVTGYGSLGMIDSEDVPLLLLQVLLCKLNFILHKHFTYDYKHLSSMSISIFKFVYKTIGIDVVFPPDIEEHGLGNLRTCLKSTGKLVLDAYYNLSRLEPSLVDIETVTPYLECSNFMLQKLLCFKQRLYNSSKVDQSDNDDSDLDSDTSE